MAVNFFLCTMDSVWMLWRIQQFAVPVEGSHPILFTDQAIRYYGFGNSITVIAFCCVGRGYMDLLHIRSLTEYNAILLSLDWFLLKISTCFFDKKHQPYSIATMGKMWPLSSFRKKKQIYYIILMYVQCSLYCSLSSITKEQHIYTYMYIYINI